MAAPQQEEAPQQAQEQRKFTAAEFRLYNKMADSMNHFHNYHKGHWDVLYKACEKGKRPAGMSIRQFLGAAEQFCAQLNGHHSIEEAYIFPQLAVKMPEFQKEVHLLGQHKVIHAGLDRLEEYVNRCKAGEVDFRLEDMKEVMDSFGPTLLTHLDEEVKALGAENMRKYWTPEEMRKIRM